MSRCLVRCEPAGHMTTHDVTVPFLKILLFIPLKWPKILLSWKNCSQTCSFPNASSVKKTRALDRSNFVPRNTKTCLGSRTDFWKLTRIPNFSRSYSTLSSCESNILGSLFRRSQSSQYAWISIPISRRCFSLPW
jgi:hypothetical protein